MIADILWNTDYAKVYTNCRDISYTDSINTFPDVQNLGDFAIHKNFGEALKIFRQLDKSKYIQVYVQTALIDCTLSISSCTDSKGFTIPNLTISEKPLLEVQKLWHPCLGINKAVSNDLTLQPQHAIITGPNAGGKSTFLKAMLINILLVQTLGISCSQQTTMTPFTFINSQINIPDCKGKESLFEAEMYRCKYNIDSVNNLSSDQFAFLAMDEIFNSTNPVEGIAGAFAVVKYLASLPNISSIVTTHYLYLTRLKQELPQHFMTYKMNVKQNGDHIDFPYKLTSGISRQYIALELLRKNGFNSDILDVAQHTKTKLLSNSKIKTQSK